ncbi:MAG: D-alanine--D-alanine ligase family protein, partial [Aggregatilineales bacterium]
MSRKTVVAVLFGGRSVEHDVSVVTGHQVMQAFDSARYEVVPVYISRDGKWFTGESLRDLDNFKDDMVLHMKDIVPVILSPDVRHHGLILNPLAGRFSRSDVKRLDIVFPAIHGTHGEDGTLQGLLDLADIPCVGFGTTGSALTNDKILSRAVLLQAGIPVMDEISFRRADWLNDPDTLISQIENDIGYPVFVKPATLGSSIGVSRADDVTRLRSSIDIAANFDRRVLVQQALTGGIEINCSVIGYGDDIQVSVLEQPVSWDDFLSYEDKYLRGDEGMKSADRLIPAPINDDLTTKIQELSVKAFHAVDGRGIVRIDYLVKPDSNEVYLNEMNTMPGSLAFYLWRATDMTAGQLVDNLVKYARDAHADKRRNVYDYKTNLIAL